MCSQFFLYQRLFFDIRTDLITFSNFRQFDQKISKSMFFLSQKLCLWRLMVTSYPENFDWTNPFNIKVQGIGLPSKIVFN